MLQRLLSTFARIEGVSNAVVLDAEMAPVASFSSDEGASLDVACGIAGILREGGRSASAVDLGDCDQIWIEGSAGNLLLSPLRTGHTLLVSSHGEANLGRLRHEMKARAPVIVDLMR